jgi:hypothetical protein
LKKPLPSPQPSSPIIAHNVKALAMTVPATNNLPFENNLTMIPTTKN